ncbi:hypothetical protein DPMN_015079 [Dreissena polymorpha]|uniref:Uncharacterized protein n=1 Tax=Dreissena polymorpha TaxID=45954 RepID=A0A9D4N749_DREPO|nr:hypothetical protein DPMN_015079 [Dreissena polymorpha]
MLKQNYFWAWSMWAGRPRIDRIVIRDVQYQLDVNRCRNEEVNAEKVARTDGRTDGGDNHIIPRSNLEPAFTFINGPGRDLFQGSSANRVGGDSVQDGRTDGGDQNNITTLLKALG